MSQLPRPFRAALAAAFGIALPVAGHAQDVVTLLADGFDSGALTAPWRCLNSSAAGTANTLVADNTAPLAGNVARFSGSSANNALLANFPAARLTQAGHFIEARFDFRYLATPSQTNANSGPLIGLYHSAGTLLAGNAFGVTNATGDDVGYKGTKLALAATGDLRLLGEQRASANVSFSSYAGATLKTADTGVIVGDTNVHAARLRIELAANLADLVLTFSFDGAATTHTVPGADVLTRTFDQLVLMAAGGLGGSTAHLDNVRVTSNAWARVLAFNFEAAADLNGWAVHIPGQGVQPANNVWLAVSRRANTAVPVVEGAQCVRLQIGAPAPASAPDAHRTWTSPLHLIGERASDRVRLRLRARTDGLAAGDVSVALIEESTDGGAGSPAGTTITATDVLRLVPTSGWMSFDKVLELAADTTALRLQVRILNNALATGALYLDDLLIDQSPDDGAYLLEHYSGARGHVLAGDGGTVVIDFYDRRPTEAVTLTVADERGPLTPQPPVTFADNVAIVTLPGRGYFAVTAAGTVLDPVRGAQPFSKTFTAAVVPPGAPDAESVFGTFAVASSNPLAARGGGRWNRFFILSQAVTAHADKVTFTSGRQGHAESQYVAVPDLIHLPTDQQWLACLINVPQSMAKVPAGRTWSQSNFYAPNDWVQFKAFIKYVVTSLPPTVEHFELINEPEYNWHGSFADLNRYFKTAREAIDELKAQGQVPNLKLLGPAFARFYSPQFPYASGNAGVPFTDHETAPIGSKQIIQDRLFRGGLFPGDTGLLSYVDEIAMHGYVNASAPETEFFAMITAFNAYVAQFGPPKPIHLTEFGWQTGSDSWQAPVGELTRAAYTSRAMILARVFDLKSILFFSLKFLRNGEATGYSALRPDDTPLPTYVAWSAAARALENAYQLENYGAFDEAGAIRAARFRNRDDSTTVCLWTLVDGVSVHLPAGEGAALTDFLGRTLTPTHGVVALTGDPIFVRLSPGSALGGPVAFAGTVTAPPGGALDVLGAVPSLLASGAFSHSARDGRLFAPGAVGRYQLIVSSSDGWAAYEVEVRSPSKPGSATPPAPVLTIGWQDSRPRLSMPAAAGFFYQLQRTETLGPVALWRNVGETSPGEGSTRDWIDASPPTARAFYRVVITP